MAQVLALARAMRPRQWTKNLLVYMPLLFTVDLHWNPGDPGEMGRLLGRVTLTFLIFCLLSGAVYLFNDLIDVERDRLHPRKRERPLASGRLGAGLAVGSGTILVGVGLSLSFLLGANTGWVALAYLVLQVAYSLYLKHEVMLDVLAISGGFVMRAAAGAVVIGVPVSPWLYIVTSLGALFLGLGKRRSELVALGEEGVAFRASLKGYTPQLLDQLTSMVAASTLIAYILYTFTAENLPTNHAMMLTIPFVMYGLFRYLYLVQGRNLGENPEDVLLTDRALQIDIILWLGMAAGLLIAFR